jgi:molybdopterin converting factor subunit 1
MKIKTSYFAAIREAIGKDGEELNVDCSTPFELFESLREIYSLEIDEKHLKFAVNEEYVAFDYRLKENDIVVFIPPVAGG